MNTPTSIAPPEICGTEPTYGQVAAFIQGWRRRVDCIDYDVRVREVEEDVVVRGRWGRAKVVWVDYCRGGTVLHSIRALTLARVRAHWLGFIEGFKVATPKVGGYVQVKVSTRRYEAKVLAVTETRVQVEFTYPSTGRKCAPRWFALNAIAWHRPFLEK